MTSEEIRQSFLHFFKSKQHTIVRSSPLDYKSRDGARIFTNAGMNQFVPIFLGEEIPDVSKWSTAIYPALPTRAADTQKCIRATGKHNDLEDVGLDTYHHTFFEMLGNWSFGDYFKQEAIEWAWELVTEVWKFPKNRLYATVYSPDKSKGDPSEFDQEAYDVWAGKFRAAGLDPKVHIVNGNKKDNFWMMGDTGPCGPCSELHVDLTPQGDTKGRLVNQATAECIEIWNLVFIQFNANPDGTFSPLPAKHVDTGMGFERVTGIMQNTRNFTDFTRIISNYETDIFRPLFDQIEKLSGKKYGSTLPSEGHSTTGRDLTAYARNPQLEIDIAFRVIADHIRTLSFAIADGIEPGNTDRNYVLRRILRRAVMFGGTLGFGEPFLYKLVSVLAEKMGDVFPEVRAKQDHIEEVIRREEGMFNNTRGGGMPILEEVIRLGAEAEEFSVFAGPLLHKLKENKEIQQLLHREKPDSLTIPTHFKFDPCDPRNNERKEMHRLIHEVAQALGARALTHNLALWRRTADPEELAMEAAIETLAQVTHQIEGPLKLESLDFVRGTLMPALSEIEQGVRKIESMRGTFRGRAAFLLSATYGLPIEEVQRLAKDKQLLVDMARYNKCSEQHKTLSRAAQRKTVISLSEIGSVQTEFVGYDRLEAECRVLNTSQSPEGLLAVVDVSPLYAEMGGQVGDAGTLTFQRDKATYRVLNTFKRGQAYVLKLESTDEEPWLPLDEAPLAHLKVDEARRFAIQRHHTVTHLLHWALHEVVSHDATQKGSYVGPEKLTFDFSSAPLTPQQVADVERLVNERILDNAAVSWTEVGYGDVKARPDIMQFFGDKYGDVVRVVQVGGKATALDGYSMELCGGTHTRATGEIGLFRIVGESAIAAGIRRIEAVSGLEAYKRANEELHLIKTVAGKVNSPVGELEKKIEALLAQQKDLEKQLKGMQQKQAAEIARGLADKAHTFGSTLAIVENLGAADGDLLQSIADALKTHFKGVVVLGGAANNAVALVATVAPELTKKFQAGKIIQAIAPIVGGKGGGRPDNARGGGKDVGKLDEALAKAKSLLG